MRINLGIRRRLAPLLGNNRRRIELMNGLLFSLPGTPVLYYGDEIGMGDNIYLGDRNGVRTPMQWSGDRNAGFSRGQPAAALPAGHHRPRVPLRGGQRRGAAGQPALAAVVDEAADRAAQAATRRSAAARSSSCTPRTARSSRSSASTRTSGSSSSPTCRASSSTLELDLSALPRPRAGRDVRPRRVPARSATLPYFLTLGPHAFYWFALEADRRPRRRRRAAPTSAPPTLDRAGRRLAGAAARTARRRR